MSTEEEQRLSQIEARVKKVVLGQLSVHEEALCPEASFSVDLMADSLDSVHLIMGFEEEFDIEIPDEDLQEITTIREASQYILNRLDH